MYVANIRATHETAPHHILSGMTLSEEQHLKFMEEFLNLEEVNEALLLQTCNRFEIYYSGHDVNVGSRNAHEYFLKTFGQEIEQHCVMDSYLDTMIHLFRAVSSIDSMIIGENQIQAQVKDAMAKAMENNHCGRVLNEVFRRALSVGKRVRTETAISHGKVSISSAAVDLVNEHFPIQGKKVIIIGTGTMSNMVANHLREFKPRDLVVIGRTPERVECFCTEHCGRISSHSELEAELQDADILFSATSCPRILVKKEMVERACSCREDPLILIDIAMPEDIDPACSEVPCVTSYCIDDLSGISERNKAQRQEAIELVEAIIAEEAATYRKYLQTAHVDRFIAPMNTFVEEIRKQEVERALRMMGDPDPRTEEIVTGLTKSLTKKIMYNLFAGMRTTPVTHGELENFTAIFMGNGHVSGNKNEKTERKCPHTGHGH
jgi:glutamyl-tRNA reductase